MKLDHPRPVHLCSRISSIERVRSGHADDPSSIRVMRGCDWLGLLRYSVWLRRRRAICRASTHGLWRHCALCRWNRGGLPGDYLRPTASLHALDFVFVYQYSYYHLRCARNEWRQHQDVYGSERPSYDPRGIKEAVECHCGTACQGCDLGNGLRSDN